MQLRNLQDTRKQVCILCACAIYVAINSDKIKREATAPLSSSCLKQSIASSLLAAGFLLLRKRNRHFVLMEPSLNTKRSSIRT